MTQTIQLGRGTITRQQADMTTSHKTTSRTFEHGVVTDSAPQAEEATIDSHELEGGATVGAGE
jgi:hypothetical protein